jgi:hypothetical protein
MTIPKNRDSSGTAILYIVVPDSSGQRAASVAAAHHDASRRRLQADGPLVIAKQNLTPLLIIVSPYQSFRLG